MSTLQMGRVTSNPRTRRQQFDLFAAIKMWRSHDKERVLQLKQQKSKHSHTFFFKEKELERILLSTKNLNNNNLLSHFSKKANFHEYEKYLSGRLEVKKFTIDYKEFT